MAFSAQIRRYQSITSTNSELARLALEGAAEGLCVIADEQTSGRGRLQREWVSPPGSGLYLSILLKPQIDLRRWSLLTLMAAVAVYDTLKDSCDGELDIKWPNDLLLSGRKVCGILAETVESNYGRAAVLGIGINLTHTAFPPDIAATAISIEEATGAIISRETILQTLISKLAYSYDLLHAKGGDTQIVSDWCGRSSYANGKLIRVSTGDEVVQGVTRGLEDDGALRVETKDGQLKVVRAGDVTAVRSTE